MIAALRNRNYDEFAQLLEEKSDENNVESEEVSAEVSAALQSLRAAVYGARGAIGGSSSIKAIIKCINVFSSNIDIVGHGLNILYYLVDHPPNCQQALDNGIVPVIILAMKTFVDDKKIQSNACGIIWVIAKDMKVRVEKGEIDEVISLIKKATELQHFQNLEIGQRNPYRFKIVVPGRALHRLEE